MRIDSHQHFWDLKKFTYPWMSPDLGVLYQDYRPEDLASLLAANGVEGAIVVQATHSEAEAEWLLSLAARAPFIKGVVGWVDLTSPDLASKLDRLKTLGPLVGIRHQVHDEPENEWLLRPEVVKGLRTLVERDLPYDLLLRPPHLPVLPALFKAVPEATWIIDHLAKPEIKTAKMEPWFGGMQKAAAYSNVFCKVSGMITEADPENWKFEDIQIYFEKVLSLFGPSRLLFGSDWPVCLLAGQYSQVCELVEKLVEPLSPSEKEMIWSSTARRVYKI